MGLFIYWDNPTVGFSYQEPVSHQSVEVIFDYGRWDDPTTRAIVEHCWGTLEFLPEAMHELQELLT
jgi:hypothetical protein